MIDDDSFFARSYVLETGRPSFKSFKAKGEGVLTRSESIALMNHCLTFSKHVSCLKIGHPEISIAGRSNVFWSMVVAVVFLGFNIRNNNAV